MNNQVITNTLKENFNISNVPSFAPETINLALINRNLELKLESELADIEKEIREIALILRTKGEATGVYAVLLGTLQRTVIDLQDQLDLINGADQIEVSLILEKIKTKVFRLDEKMDVLSTFVYSWDEISA